MSSRQPPLATPVYIKEDVAGEWPADPVFYVLGSNGLSLGRNHEMFRSCALVRHGPSELAAQESFLEPRYPKLSRELIEQLVGFFSEMAERYRCEVGGYLIFDRESGVVSAQVPNQLSTVSESCYGSLWPIGLDYASLDPPPSSEMVIGTIHSHVYGSAYASGIDVHDELDKPGVHLVVGKLDKEPPEFHVEAVVDGARFTLGMAQVVEGYEERRADFPPEWIDRVEVKVNRWSNYGTYGTSGKSAGTPDTSGTSGTSGRYGTSGRVYGVGGGYDSGGNTW